MVEKMNMAEDEQEFETDSSLNSRTSIVQALVTLIKRKASNWRRLMFRPADRKALRNESDVSRIY
jgi:hypothetical protein